MSLSQRRAYRSVLTKEVNALEELINFHPEDIGTLQAKLATLTSTYEKLTTLNEQVLNTLIAEEVNDEEAIEEEITSANEYSTKFHEVSIKVQNILLSGQRSTFESCHDESTKSRSTKIRLPKIELKKFDGEFKNWIGFWTQFSKIHDDANLGEEDKFHYLLQSMLHESPPCKLIEGFPPSKENYGKAVEMLKSRYGKDEFLIEYYVRELLALVLNKNEFFSVTSLYDKLEIQLRALDSLGVTKEKYAAMLFPLVETALPESIFKIWDRYRVTKNASTKEPDNCLTELLQFLKTEVEGEGRLKLRENTFSVKPNEKATCKKEIGQKPLKSNTPSAAVLVASENKARLTNNTENSNRNLCLFCEKPSHNSSDCFTLIEKTVSERSELVKKKGGCLRCLRKGHLAQNCKVQVKCHFCKGRHLAILCQNVVKASSESDSERNVEIKTKTPVQNTTNSFSTVDNDNKTTYLQTLNAFIEYNGKSTKVRILCDSGSQKSFISSHCVNKIGLKEDGEILIQQEIFGGKKTGPKRHRVYNICLNSLNSEFQAKVCVVEQPVICNQVPKFCDSSLIEKLKNENIVLSDVSFTDWSKELSNSIDVLLGADTWTKIITSEFRKVHDQLVAIKTQLGWTIVGSTSKNSTSTESSFVSTMFVSSIRSSDDIQRFWELETMGITEPAERLKKEEIDDRIIDHFEKTVKQDSSGRYIVKLPWTEDHPTLETNRHVAEKRLMTTTRKLKNMKMFTDYDLVFKEWCENGIIEKVTNPSTFDEKVHYLPHQAVIKEGSTTRIRPVFDASCKDRNGFCLNDCLETGPNLIELVPKTLTNLRMFAFALSSDIEKAFLQISVQEDDRNMLRFLWWEKENIVVYRHTRVVFGLSCSPFLLSAVIKYLLSNAPDDLKPIAEKLSTSFYVDNCLTGVDYEEEQESFIREAQELLKLGKFNLRGWIGNGQFNKINQDYLQDVLGMKWDCCDDTLFSKVSFPPMNPEELTRRSLLSHAQKIYDPIGFTAPTSLVPKIMLQKTWSLKIGWDEILPEDLRLEFKKWSDQILCLKECKLRRRIIINDSSTLHVFSDASKIAYGACVFLRTKVNSTVHISLILAKCRVSPIKPITLPRLELIGALTGVRLCDLALKCLNRPNIQVNYWSDSSVTLAWIANQGKWNAFIENRVREINKFTCSEQWRYVPGQLNPADLVSRGCSPMNLLKSQWWNGPKWLCEPPDMWPTGKPSPNKDVVDIERKKSVTIISVVETSSIAESLSLRFSKYSNIVRTVAWMLRLKYQGKGKPNITSEEFMRAEKVLFKLVQKDSFSGDCKMKKLSGIRTLVDTEGIIRLRSRLLNEEYSREYTQPIILPSDHVVVERFVLQQHIHNKHVGVQALLSILRENTWILKGRKTISRIVHQCIPCKKMSTKPLDAPEAPLPTDRTTLTSCFETTGIDLAGPLIAKKNKKYWVIIFTCAVYRAVHLELVPSLSTDAFILSLRRFIARRGRVSVIYTDNGLNFVGLNNQLKKIDWRKIENEFVLEKIIWRFNPPAAPWWGGYWERLIRILKDLLRKNLGHACLDFEELNTLICECEDLMNRRPLTYVSENIEDLKPLTPSMFMHSLHGNDTSDLDFIDAASLNYRLKYLLKIRQGLKDRFQKEYLGFLRSSKKNMKKENTVREGDIVLIHCEGKKRVFWPLGKIEKIFPGKDTVTRLVRVKTKNGTLLRPVQRIYPLEINSQNQPDFDKFQNLQNYYPVLKVAEEEKGEVLKLKQTRSGRTIVKPKRLDL